MATPAPREPITPGEILKEEFLDPLGITVYRLCQDTPLREDQVGAIIKGKRTITDETDAALCKYFGLSRGYWRRMQISYDQRKKARQLRTIEDKVTPYKETYLAKNHTGLVSC